MRFALIVAILLAATLLGCVQEQKTEVGKITITDLAGRSVEVPKDVHRIVALGPGALRLVVYLNATDMVVGVENSEKPPEEGGWSSMGRPYRMAHPELAEKPVIGKGGPSPIANAEAIVKVKPDVIFAYMDPGSAERLQSQTGIPVVVIDYGELGNFRSKELYDSLRLMGKIIGREERAEEVIAYIESTYEDLKRRVEDVPEGEKLSVYVGALGFKGGHGITMTACPFPPFEAVKAKNVACEAKMRGTFEVDKEQIARWDPDVIFLDLNNLYLVRSDYEKSPEYYKSLKAFREHRVYGILPFNWYNTNIETALIDAYVIGKILYPEKFSDVDIKKKASQIFEFFVGKNVYDELVAYYGEPGGEISFE